MNVYYFNPDNDLALAGGGEHYNPTPMAERLRQCLQLLPCWIAEPGSLVLCDDDSSQSWIDAQGLDVRLITRKDLPRLADCEFRPWGWSSAMRWRLLHWGADESLLPTTAQIASWRQLAHRRTSIRIHHRVSELAGYRCCPAPVELDNIDDILRFARAYPGCYVKEPWSGSGRGIYRALDPLGQDFIQRCKGALNRQGSMLCEQAMDRTVDFAVELDCRSGKSSITGYSIFESDFHLQYAGGIVDTSTVLERIISFQYPDFHRIKEIIPKVIDEVIAPVYEGPVGIDMLLFRNADGTTGINPCVELNLRTTMGMVTSALGDRHGFRGHFHIIDESEVTTDNIVLTPSSGNMAAVIKPFSNE